MKKKPVDATPDLHEFAAPPESTHDVINRYGTYNIQPTSATDDTFPLIAHGLPKAWRDIQLGKKSLEEEE